MRRLHLVMTVFLAGCGGLPTQPVPGNCAKDDQCPAGWRCGSDKNQPDTYFRCFCATASCRDAGTGGLDVREGDLGVGPDLRTTCARNEDCPAARPICGPGGACLECTEASHCKDPGKSFCTANVCVGCQGAGADACKAPTAACDPGSGKCVECTGDALCTADPVRPFCVASVCSACSKKEAAACATQNPAKPACAPTGACVQCTEAATHCKEAGKAFCVANACVGCQTAGAGACKAPTGACDAASGRCVECTADSQCSGDPARPLCIGNACVSCTRGTANACASKDMANPVCSPTGSCVECITSTHCAVATKPVCVTNKCAPCTTDAQCADKPGPGICMAHQDGRCATESETIYVQNAATCSSAPTAGTPTTPFCKPQNALGAVTASRRLVLITGPAAVAGFTWSGTSAGQLSVIGRSTATIAGGPDIGIRISSGEIYVRDAVISRGADVGIIAGTGTTLRLERVLVDDNLKGGVLLDGAAFQIVNTTISRNGPGDLMGFGWGGIRVQNAPGMPSVTRLERVTIRDNKERGLSCSGSIEGVGVFAMGNAGTIDIAPACAVTACAPAGPMCGAQP